MLRAKIHRPVLAIGLALALAGLTTSADAQTVIVYACVNNSSGTVKIVAPNATCQNNETLRTWNTVGPVGPTGPAGYTGATGPQGPPGPAANLGSISGQLDACSPTFNYTGALIYIPGRAFNVISGPTGTFQIDNVPPGTYDLNVEMASGFTTTVPQVNVGTESVVLFSSVVAVDITTDTNNCGACGVSCGAGAACVNSACQAAPPPPMCTPVTCAAVGKNCGQIGDGCGGIIACGSCQVGLICGAGGTANVCGAPTCIPKTSASFPGLNCGVVANGCGGVINLGSCQGSQTCGGGGIANQCGAP